MKDWGKEFTNSEIKTLTERFEKKAANAEKRKIKFTLTMDDWFMMGKKLLGMGCCDYTDMPFSLSIYQGYNPRYPSVERIDDKLGYVRGNVCVVCRRANELKDVLVDKKTAITIIDPLDREMVQAMMLHMSQEHLDQLKTVYIPEEENEEMINMNHHAEAAHNEAYNALASFPESAEVELPAEPYVAQEEEVVEEKPALPEDVAVALAYANACKDFHAVGMNVTVSYAQFKAKYSRTTCALSGEKLTGEPKSILVLDLGVGFAKDNFVIVSEKLYKALTQLMISTGMSLPKITAMMNKVV